MNIINLGCGKVLMPDAVNVDGSNPMADITMDVIEYLALHHEDNSVDEIYADHLVEHLPFSKEERFFNECKRVLKDGGILHIKVPDFEWACDMFLMAEENDYAWYQKGSADHYFGGGFDASLRWSFLISVFFGHQDGGGQLHCNAYTEGKLLSIGELLSMKCEIAFYERNHKECIYAKFTK